MNIRKQVFKLCKKYRIPLPYFDGAYLYATNGKTLVKIPAKDIGATKNTKGYINDDGYPSSVRVDDFPKQPLQDDWSHNPLSFEVRFNVKLLKELCDAMDVDEITMRIPLDPNTGDSPDIPEAIVITDYYKKNQAIGYIMPLRKP